MKSVKKEEKKDKKETESVKEQLKILYWSM